MASALMLSTPPVARTHRSLQPKEAVHLPSNNRSLAHLGPYRARRHLRTLALQETKEAETTQSAEEITKKYGLEFGLWKVSITADETGGKVGTFALAYAAHKAASPIRFPPTVALTPIVASWIGKKADQTDD